MISDGMVRGLKDFFKDYNGCRNCKHQPAPLTMCDYGKRKTYVELICSGWERKDGDENDIRWPIIRCVSLCGYRMGRCDITVAD